MNERYRADHDILERMLAHVLENKVSGAYDRAEHLLAPKELAQIWADLILKYAKPAAACLKGVPPKEAGDLSVLPRND